MGVLNVWLLAEKNLELRQIVESKGGRILSGDFDRVRQKISVVCAEGHTWKPQAGNVIAGSWCPVCMPKKNGVLNRHSIDYVRKYVEEEFEGKCLFEEYPGSHVALSFECSHGHKFSKNFGAVVSGKWCPECSSTIGERFCRIFLTRLFQAEFVKVRSKQISWLKQPNGSSLELDGYCEERSIAFEHQGSQHYRRVKLFHPNESDFWNQQRRDEWKRELCKANDVTLIEIAELSADLRIDVMREKVLDAIRYAGVTVPTNAHLIAIKGSEIYMSNSEEYLSYFQKYAEERKGTLVSTLVPSINSHITFQCKAGHVWSVKAANVKSKNYWCRKCSFTNTSIEPLRNAVFLRHGVLLDTEYKGAHAKYRIICENGHSFEASATAVAATGSWCAECAGSKRGTIEGVRAIVEARGGRVLSTVYNNERTPIQVDCGKGHTFDTNAGYLNSGNWCRYCANNQQKTLQHLQAAAELKGGTCLSKNYLGAREKHLFRCSEGHEWSARASNIMTGTWCPKCGFISTGKQNSKNMIGKSTGARRRYFP